MSIRAKWVYILVIILLIIYTLKIYFRENNNNSAYLRKTLDKFRGVMIGHSETSGSLKKDIHRMKEMGVNIIAVRPQYCVKRNGTISLILTGPLRLLDPEREYINNIRVAHQNGLAVFLELNTINPLPDCYMTEVADKERFIQDFIPESVRWAKIAEKEQVELFSPLNESNMVIGREKGYEWNRRVLPEVKKNYTGDMVLKLAEDNSPVTDCFGYDYLAFDVFPGEIEEWKPYVNKVVENMRDLVGRYNLKGAFLGEVGSPIQGDPYDRANKLIAGKIVDENIQAEVFRILFSESWDKIKGYFILEWTNSSKDAYFIKDPAKRIITDWYKNNREKYR